MPRLTYRYITMVTDESCDEKLVSSLFEEKGFRIVKMDYSIDFTEKKKTFIFTVTTTNDSLIKEVIGEIGVVSSVRKLEVKS